MKLITLETLQHVIESYNEFIKNDFDNIDKKIQDETTRAIKKENDLAIKISDVEKMLGGRSLIYVTQEEYDNLSDEEKANDKVMYLVTDPNYADADHEHDDLYYTKAMVNTLLSLKADANHGVHVLYSSDAPMPNGAASAGDSDEVSRADHIHPEQINVSGYATKLKDSRNFRIGNSTKSFDGTKDVTWSLIEIGAAEEEHSHPEYGTKDELSELDNKITNLGTTLSAQTDQKISKAINDLIDSAPEALDTLNELAEAISSHESVYEGYISNITTQLETKANKADVDKLKLDLDDKADIEHGYHVPDPEYIMTSFLRSDNEWASVTPESIGAAPKNHGTHVEFSTSAPMPAGVASIGSATTVSRGDHVHPEQEDIIGNAGTATKLQNKRGITIGEIKKNFDGSSDISFSLTEIGAAPTSHGSHVPPVESVQFNRFLRNDRTWATVTPANIGAAASNHGTHVTYATTSPKEAGASSVGTEDTVSRGDHVHPAQTTITGNAGSATKLQISRNITVGNKIEAFNGTSDITFTLDEIGAAAKSHGTHLTLGTTNSTAFRGDQGYTAYMHSIADHAPADAQKNSLITKAEIETKLTGTITTHNHSGIYAPYSHGTHVVYSTTAPKEAGVSSIGTEDAVSRGDHVHPAQTSVSGNAGTATKFASAQKVTLTGDVTGSVTSQAGWTVPTTLSSTGVTAGTYGPSANASPGHSGTFEVPQIEVDSKGRVISAYSRTIAFPANPNTDTKVKYTLGTTTKFHLTGTTSDSTGTGELTFDTGIYATTTAGQLSVGSLQTRGAITTSGNGSHAIGSVANRFSSIYGANIYSYDKNGLHYASLRLQTEGSVDTQGVGRLVAGNSTSSGTIGNAKGQIILYGTDSGYTLITPGHNSTGSVTLTLPSISGTLAKTSDLDSYLPLGGGSLTGTLYSKNIDTNGIIDTSGDINIGGNLSIWQGSAYIQKELIVDENIDCNQIDTSSDINIGGNLSVWQGSTYIQKELVVDGSVECSNYLKINAWPGYGSGTASLWYDGNAGNIQCSSGIKTDKALHAEWHCNFGDGFSIPTRDGDRRGVLFNTYGSGANSYLEIIRRNSANTDWDWGNSIRFYPNEVKVPSLLCYSGGGCLKLYPGDSGHTYMGFFLNNSTRGAWIGYGSNGSSQFTIQADGGTGRVQIENLNVGAIPLTISASAPGCGGVWIQV